MKMTQMATIGEQKNTTFTFISHNYGCVHDVNNTSGTLQWKNKKEMNIFHWLLWG